MCIMTQHGIAAQRQPQRVAKRRNHVITTMMHNRLRITNIIVMAPLEVIITNMMMIMTITDTQHVFVVSTVLTAG